MRIRFLISFMESLIRIKVRNKIIKEIDTNDTEKCFVKL